MKTRLTSLLAFALLISVPAFAREQTDLEKARDAVKHYDAEALDSLLIPKGSVDPNSEMNAGESFLIYSASRGYLEDNADKVAPIVQVLLEHGADTSVTDKNHYTPLILAIHMDRPKTVDLLIAHGANVNYRWCRMTKNGKGAQIIDPYDVARQQIGLEISLADVEVGPDTAPSTGLIGVASGILNQLKAADAVSWLDTADWKFNWEKETQDCQR